MASAASASNYKTIYSKKRNNGPALKELSQNEKDIIIIMIFMARQGTIIV